MLYVNVNCFRDFHCIAGECPDTCCAGWEVDLDEKILEKYAAMPGPLGQEIRNKIVQEDGYTFFRMEGVRCPFLNEENLCRLILEAGEECLSVTCREHPRFWEEYGHLQETCLAISCPEAARLLFSEPFRLTVTETDEPELPDEDLDPELLEDLLAIREDLFAVATEKRPMEQRLEKIKGMARGVQGLGPAAGQDMADFFRMLLTMEFTDDRLPGLLDTALRGLPAREQVHAFYQEYPMEAENLLLYFLYRYVLRAVWDGCLAEKVYLAVYALEAIFTLAAAQPGEFSKNLMNCAIVFSREVEHSPENLSRVYGYFGQ